MKRRKFFGVYHHLEYHPAKLVFARLARAEILAKLTKEFGYWRVKVRRCDWERARSVSTQA